MKATEAMRELSTVELDQISGGLGPTTGPINGPVITLYRGVNLNWTYNTITGEFSGMQMFGPTAPQVIYM